MTPEEVITNAERFAKENNLLLKHDKRMEVVVNGLAKKAMLCPCRLDPTPCPCPDCLKDVAEHGCCHCGLFWKDEI